jgi:hypothetical protein
MSALRASQLPPSMRRRLGVKAEHKYHAVRRKDDDGPFAGVRFDSQREATRAGELLYQVKAGAIRDLQIHPSFPIRVNDVLIGVYEADFRYVDAITGKAVIEDAKGVRTPLYKLKKKLVEAIYGIEIQEV